MENTIPVQASAPAEAIGSRGTGTFPVDQALFDLLLAEAVDKGPLPADLLEGMPAEVPGEAPGDASDDVSGIAAMLARVGLDGLASLAGARPTLPPGTLRPDAPATEVTPQTNAPPMPADADALPEVRPEFSTAERFILDSVDGGATEPQVIPAAALARNARSAGDTGVGETLHPFQTGVGMTPASQNGQPAILAASSENPFVRPGEGKALAELHLENFDVRRFEIRTEVAPQTNAPPMPADADALQEVRPEFSTAERFILDSVEGGAAEPQAIPAAALARNARSAGDTGARETLPGTTHLKAESVHVSDDAVQWTSEVPREMNDPGQGGDPRAATPRPQPAKPVVSQTFSLEPARRVTMLVGESGNEVHVQVRENQGEVSVRFNAPHAVRGGLEASVQNLVDSLSREQVTLTDLSFSGPADHGAGSGESRHGDARRPHRPDIAVAGDAEEIGFTPEFETVSTGSRIRLTA